MKSSAVEGVHKSMVAPLHNATCTYRQRLYCTAFRPEPACIWRYRGRTIATLRRSSFTCTLGLLSVPCSFFHLQSPSLPEHAQPRHSVTGHVRQANTAFLPIINKYREAQLVATRRRRYIHSAVPGSFTSVVLRSCGLHSRRCTYHASVHHRSSR